MICFVGGFIWSQVNVLIAFLVDDIKKPQERIPGVLVIFTNIIYTNYWVAAACGAAPLTGVACGAGVADCSVAATIVSAISGLVD